jgi:hypothetical protein
MCNLGSVATDANNILLLPGPGYSYVKPMKLTTDILINEYHHNVTWLLTESVAKHPALKDLHGEVVTYDKDGNVGKWLQLLIRLVSTI